MQNQINKNTDERMPLSRLVSFENKHNDSIEKYNFPVFEEIIHKDPSQTIEQVLLEFCPYYT